MIRSRRNDFFAPDENYTYGNAQSYVVDQQVLAFLVGVIALGLPIALLVATALGTCFYDSISHFYFSQFFGDIFVVALAAIGTFLLAYRGESQNENRLATAAGVCAILVALFPTNGRGCEQASFSGRILADVQVLASDAPVAVTAASEVGQYFQLFADSETVHFTAATGLFVFLFFYSAFVFTRVIPSQHLGPNGELTAVKRVRNRIYRISGFLIVLSMAAIAAEFLIGENWTFWDENNLTFWFEALALWAFGGAWMVKGRFWGRFLLDPRDFETSV